MSDAPLDLREQLARIDRARAETENCPRKPESLSSRHKLAAKRDKLAAEARKLTVTERSPLGRSPS